MTAALRIAGFQQRTTCPLLIATFQQTTSCRFGNGKLTVSKSGFHSTDLTNEKISLVKSQSQHTAPAFLTLPPPRESRRFGGGRCPQGPARCASRECTPFLSLKSATVNFTVAESRPQQSARTFLRRQSRGKASAVGGGRCPQGPARVFSPLFSRLAPPQFPFLAGTAARQ